MEYGFKNLQPRCNFCPLTVRQEMPEAVQERERVALDKRMGTRFDQGERGQGFKKAMGTANWANYANG